MPSLDPGLNGSNPNFYYRGAPNDHLDANSGRFKKLILIFPLGTPGSVPKGAVGDPTSVSSSGVIQEASLELFVNPRQLTFRHPTRSQIIQTIGGAYVDSFGYGLPTGQIQGTFGWGKDEFSRTGLDRAATLKSLYEGWQQLTVTQTALCRMMLVGNTTKETGINLDIFLGDLEMTRSQNSPLTVDYALSFTVMKDYNGPVRPQIIPPVGTIPVDGSTPPIVTGPGGIR